MRLRHASPRIWLGPDSAERHKAAMRGCGHRTSATLRDRIVASGQTLMAVTAQLSAAPAHHQVGKGRAAREQRDRCSTNR
jgi:hypothetical protein